MDAGKGSVSVDAGAGAREKGKGKCGGGSVRREFSGVEFSVEGEVWGSNSRGKGSVDAGAGARKWNMDARVCNGMRALTG